MDLSRDERVLVLGLLRNHRIELSKLLAGIDLLKISQADHPALSSLQEEIGLAKGLENRLWPPADVIGISPLSQEKAEVERYFKENICKAYDVAIAEVEPLSEAMQSLVKGAKTIGQGMRGPLPTGEEVKELLQGSRLYGKAGQKKCKQCKNWFTKPENWLHVHTCPTCKTEQNKRNAQRLAQQYTEVPEEEEERKDNRGRKKGTRFCTECRKLFERKEGEEQQYKCPACRVPQKRKDTSIIFEKGYSVHTKKPEQDKKPCIYCLAPLEEEEEIEKEMCNACQAMLSNRQEQDRERL